MNHSQIPGHDEILKGADCEGGHTLGCGGGRRRLDQYIASSSYNGMSSRQLPKILITAITILRFRTTDFPVRRSTLYDGLGSPSYKVEARPTEWKSVVQDHSSTKSHPAAFQSGWIHRTH
jgi:hypothetical protein